MTAPVAARREPALRFFVDLVEAEGGAVQDMGERVLLLLEDGLRRRLGLPEELMVSDDPEVVAEVGGLLAVPGQPVVVDAAELVLRRGDAGWRHVEWPPPPLPTRERLQEALREQLVVEHGRLDVEGQPAPCYLPFLHVAALLGHRVFLEERSEERAAVLVDACTASVLAPPMADALTRLASREGPGTGHLHAEPDLLRALGAAHAALDARAAARQAVLVREARAAFEKERERVDSYYEAALASIDARRAGATSERARLYDAQGEATRAEWARRREETEEKFAGTREVLPFRAHVLEVPGLRVPVTVRRGPRAYRMGLDWVLALGRVLPCRCPHCGAEQPLVAGRDRLGCDACLPRLVREGDGAGTTPATKTATHVAPDQAPDEAAGEAQARAEPGDPNGAGETERTPEPRRREADPRRAKQVEKVWRDVALGFWRSVAMHERFRSVAPRSPLDALYRCYGPRGPLRAVGVPPDALLSGMHSFAPEEPFDDVVATNGALRTSEGYVHYTLRWRLMGKEPSVVEVLPLRPPRGGRSLRVGRRTPANADTAVSRVAPRPKGLGAVEALLWTHGIGDGLPLVMRCLALYWRVQGQRRLGGFDPGALAAAVELTARRHSLLRSDATSVARRHGVPPATVRDACDTLDSLLGAAATQMW